MKRYLYGIVTALVFAVAATGCGSDGGDGVPTVTSAPVATTTPSVTPLPDDYESTTTVELGQYKGLEYEAEKVEITDEDVEEEIAALLEERPNYQKLDDRAGTAVKDKDILSIDFVGKLDGVAFEGGTGSADLEIGSGAFIPGFESSLIGKTIGETCDITVTFPDEYKNNPDLAGKETVFTVTIHYAEEAIGLTDEYVQNLKVEDCETVDEYKAYLKERMTLEAESMAEQAKWTALLAMAVENATYTNIDPVMVDYYYSEVISTYEAYASYYAAMGFDFETFILYFYGTDVDTFYEEQRKLAEQREKEYALLDAIIEAEQLVITDEVYQEYVKSYMEEAGMDDQAKFEEAYTVEYIEECIRYDMALDVIFDSAIITETGSTEEDTDDADTEQ